MGTPRDDRDKQHRRSIRLPDYDYREDGAYFVTIVTQGKLCLFGDVVDDAVRLNVVGKIVAESWVWLSRQHAYVYLDDWVVMPNHLHGIIVMSGSGYEDGRRGGSRTAPTSVPIQQRKPLGRLIGAFKTVSTKRINELQNSPGQKVWQRNYNEHIIRNPDDMNRIRAYIETNPAQWAVDRENPFTS